MRDSGVCEASDGAIGGKPYEQAGGSLGALTQGLRGRMTLAYGMKKSLGDDPEMHKQSGTVFMLYLRAQLNNGNPRHCLGSMGSRVAPHLAVVGLPHVGHVR